MDFQFSPVDRYCKVLISGAISNSLDRFKTTKLEGRPLYLPRAHEEVRPMSDQEMRRIKNACLAQFTISLKTSKNTLNINFIQNYIKKDNKKSVIVLFSGSSDIDILFKLGIDQYPILNILCYDTTNTRRFYLQLENLRTRKFIHEIELGNYNKQGRLLNLVETQNLICKKKTHTTRVRMSNILSVCSIS